MLVIMAALKQEIAAMEKSLCGRKYSNQEQIPLCHGEYNGKEVMLVLTGMGRKRAERATHIVLQSNRVKLLVSLGFAGALNPDLAGGDIILCSGIHCQDGNGNKTASHINGLDNGIHTMLCRALESDSINFRTGEIVSVMQPMQTAEERAVLRDEFNAEIVDMESYWIASIAAQRQVPFLALRAVSDTVDDSFPPIEQIVDIEGNLLPGKAALYFLSHPWHLTMLFGLYRNSIRAAKNLNEVIKRLVTVYE
jgi:adenosylhomocysteine nucleosidase